MKASAASLMLAALMLLPNYLAAKTAKPVPAPEHIPAQILSAKTAFISNAGVDNPYFNSRVPKFTGGDPYGIYDQFYDAVKKWGHWQLVSAPADADVVLEISAIYIPSVGTPIIHLRILDPKSTVTLWSFYEELGFTPRNWDKTLAQIMQNIQLVATPTSTPSSDVTGASGARP